MQPALEKDCDASSLPAPTIGQKTTHVRLLSWSATLSGWIEARCLAGTELTGAHLNRSTIFDTEIVANL